MTRFCDLCLYCCIQSHGHWPTLVVRHLECVGRYQAGRESRKQEHELLKRELTVDHDEKHNAQKKEEDETAIESVVKAEENIKDCEQKNSV